MCGRYTLRTRLNLVLSQFSAEQSPYQDWSLWGPRYNIAPTQTVPAVRQPEQGAKRELVALRWGLIPSWAKDAKIAYSTINARADTVATKPAFRSAFKKRRCLVVADGYYEWLKEGKAKLPQLYEMDDGWPFAFAGLWEWWGGPDGKSPVESCSLITTDANELAAKVHDRMPVILPPEDYDLWLDPEFEDREKLQSMLRPFPGDEMRVRPVSTHVNNARNEGPECLNPPVEE
jgi:putative SOS response-associated peptidase YedK